MGRSPTRRPARRRRRVPAHERGRLDHADLDEVRREARAQIERAILWGFDVSHLDTAHSTMLLRPEFFDVYLDSP